MGPLKTVRGPAPGPGLRLQRTVTLSDAKLRSPWVIRCTVVGDCTNVPPLEGPPYPVLGSMHGGDVTPSR